MRILSVLLIALLFLLVNACSNSAPEDPFGYPFIKRLHLKRQPDSVYSGYKAFYLLTEDFEPLVESPLEIESIREVLKFASLLSSTYKVPWTHFVDANTLAPAFVADDQGLKESCRAMIADLRAMREAGDDCELHLHGPLNREVLDQLKAEEKLHLRRSGESPGPYRQRRSFFYESFQRAGYRELVGSLTYGKRLLETAFYGDQQEVLAFRPGGWDHGNGERDTQLYFGGLSDAGLIANSGLSTGEFGGRNWRIGADPGRNLATVLVGEKRLFEVYPTAGPGGYVNPVTPHDLSRLANSLTDEMPVIVAVYHLGALQRLDNESKSSGAPKSDAELRAERGALEREFKTVADLAAAKVIYPITLRELLAIVSEQQ